MIRLVKLLALSCALALTAAGSIALFNTKPTFAQSEDFAEKQSLAATIIEQTLEVMRIEGIYSELRYAASELYLPYYESIEKKLEERNADQQSIDNARLFTRFLRLSITASNELEPVLANRRSEMIADYADVFARYLSTDKLLLIEEGLQTPAAGKFGNIFYAYSRLLTGYSNADFRSLDEALEIALDLNLELEENPFEPKNGPPPSQERVEKAEAIIADLIRISRLDDMVNDIVSFGNNTLLELDSLSSSEREDIKNSIQQIQFYYNLGKSMAVAVAPSALATVGDLEELNKLHRIILLPFLSKSFDLIQNLVREATSFTPHDLMKIKQLSERAEDIETRNPIEEDKMKEEIRAVSDKWTKELMNSLTPETRLGLEQTIEELSGLAEKGERQLKKYNEENETQL